MVKATDSFASWLGGWAISKEESVLSEVHSLEASRDRAIQSIEKYEVLIANEVNEVDKQNRIKYLSFYQEELKAINTKLRKAKKLLKADPNSKEVANAEYQKLMNHPMITSVVVKDNKLLIATKDLTLEGVPNSDMEEFIGKDIGRFLIKLTHARFEWYMQNMDWQTHGVYDRPHVREGKACLGEYEAVFKQWEKAGKLYELVDSIIYFLRTAYTSGDSYISMSEWFGDRVKIGEHEIGIYEEEYNEDSDYDD